RLGAEIGAPFPAGDVNLDGTLQRVHANVAIAAQGDGPEIAGAHLIDANDFGGGGAELLNRVGIVHAIDVAGVHQALHVFAQTEDRGALLGFVAADAFKDRGAII